MRLIVVALALVAAALLFPRPVQAWPGNCQTQQWSTGAAGICESGVSSDRHAICISYAYDGTEWPRYYTRGPWKTLGYTSVVYINSAFHVTSRWNGKNYSC
jgi:hypothetical protein